MNRAWVKRTERIERNVDRMASAVFAAAAGYAGFVWFAFRTSQPWLGVETGITVAFAYFISVCTLGAVKPAARKVPVPIFDVRNVEPIEAAEESVSEPVEVSEPFEATPAESASTEDASAGDASTDELPSEAEEEPLLLDDIVAEIGPNSRVVRLFDREAMLTAGELKSRIDRHLDGDATAAQTPDATQALHDAIRELRRSIR
jgi:hypothetical protein